MRVTLLALGCLLIMGVAAQAIPFVPNNYNGVFFTNDEVWIDRDQSGTVTVGDVFWGTFKMNQISGPTNLIGQGGPQIWGPGANPREITGYFAQEVFNIVPGTAPGTIIAFNGPISNPGLDPNGIITAADLADSVVVKMYEDNNPLFPFGNYNATTQQSAWTTATDGTLLWTLGMQNNAGTPSGIQSATGMDIGYWFTSGTPNPSLPIGFNLIGDSFAGLNVVVNNSGISKFGPVTDPQVMLPAPWSSPNYNHFWLNSEILLNPAAQANGFALGPNQPMHFFSNDPGVYFPIPEPTTLALFGLGLVGAFGLARRRRRT